MNNNKPTAIFISLDQSLLDHKSDNAFKRHLQYAKHFQHLYIIVLNTKHQFKPQNTSNLTIIPTNSNTKIQYISDSLKIINNLKSKQFINLLSTQDPFIPGLIGVISKLKFGIPLNIQVHNDFFTNPFWRTESLQNQIFFQLSKLTLLFADTIRTVSPTITNYLKDKFPNKSINTVSVSANPIFKPTPQSGQKFDLIAVGRLSRQKNFSLLIRSIAKLKQHNPTIKLALVGEGPERNKLLDLTNKLGVGDNVKFFGFQKPAKVVKLLSQSKVYISTSDYEGSSIALLEAALSGLPIITTNVSGAQSIVDHNQNGLLVATRNPEAITDAIKRLTNDAKLQKKFSAHSLKKAQDFIKQNPPKSWIDILYQTANKTGVPSHMKQANITHYNKAAGEIDKARSHPSKKIYYKKISNWLAKYIKPNTSVLDVGGGAGVLTQLLNQKVNNLQIFGLDISILMCQLREKVGLSPNLVADMDRLPFKNNSFDNIIFIASIRHTLNTDLALQEAYRALKPGGQLLLVEHNSFRYLLQPIQDRAIPAPHDPRECLINHRLITSQAKRAGFVVESVSLHRQLILVLEAFVKKPPFIIYKIASIFDDLFHNIPLYRELGSLMLIRATKP